MIFSTVREDMGFVEHLLVNDKVHKGIPCEGGQIGVLFFDQTRTQMAAMVRYKMTDVVPSDWQTLVSLPEGERFCIPFSLSSYASGCGTTLLNSLRVHCKEARVVTLSPRDESVRRYHCGNGAEVYGESVEFRNFEYR